MKEFSRTKNSVLGMITGFAGQILIILINFVCRTVFIRYLGVEYLGINGLFSDILSMLSLAELGFDTAISFRLYKPIAEKDTNRVQAYLAFFKRAYIIIGSVVFLSGLVIIPFLKFFIADYDSLANLGINAAFVFILFLIQNASTYLFFAYRSIVLKVDQKKYILDLIGILTSIFSGIAKILVIIFLKSFIAYIICATLFLIIQNLINAIVATRLYPEYFAKHNNRITKEERIDLFKDCGALFVYKINGVVMKATDNLVLSAFIGLAIVGRYSNYTMIYLAIFGILRTIYLSVKASMGNLFVTENVQKKYFFFEVMNFLSIILYGTAAIGIACVSNEIIVMWIGPEYVLPQPFPIILGVELLLTGLKENLAQIRHVSGVFKQMWFRPVLGSIINIVFSILLVKRFGISGVVMGTILAAIFANLLVDPLVIHKFSFSKYKTASYYYKKNLLFVAMLGIIGLCVFILCKNIIFNNVFLSIITHIVICSITVPFALVLLFWRREECVYIRKKLVGIIKKDKYR